MDSGTVLFLSVVFSAIGMGYFVYGKRQKKGIAMISGLLLCAYPYFISNAFLFFSIGIVLAALPFFIKY